MLNKILGHSLPGEEEVVVVVVVVVVLDGRVSLALLQDIKKHDINIHFAQRFVHLTN